MAREDLTYFEKLLYDDSYTSSTKVYDSTCYICNDPDFAQMGLPLCRTCPKCVANGKLGHVAADDSICTVCGYNEYEAHLEEEADEHPAVD